MCLDPLGVPDVNVPGSRLKQAGVNAPCYNKTMKIQLLQIAHARSGDKGQNANVGVIARKSEFYPLLEKYLTAERVAKHFEGICLGRV